MNTDQQASSHQVLHANYHLLLHVIWAHQGQSALRHPKGYHCTESTLCIASQLAWPQIGNLPASMCTCCSGMRLSACDCRPCELVPVTEIWQVVCTSASTWSELHVLSSQEEEELKVRKNFHPTRRTAQQVKADEDFALRMQRQEREIAAHQVAHYQEMQRRQDGLDDMGGVPQGRPQVHILTLGLNSNAFACGCPGTGQFCRDILVPLACDHTSQGQA